MNNFEFSKFFQKLFLHMIPLINYFSSKKSIMKSLLTMIMNFLFGKRIKSNELVTQQKEKIKLQEKEKNKLYLTHYLDTQNRDLDESIEKVDARVLKLDEEIKALVIKNQIQQAKAKISDMKTYYQILEEFKNNKSMLPEMRIQLDSMSMEKIESLKKRKEEEQKWGSVKIDVQEIFRQQTKTNDLSSPFNNIQKEIDNELAKYLTWAAQSETQQELNQVPVLPAQFNNPQVLDKQEEQQPQLPAFQE
ncbi:hypothetical protein pb186bvf_003769 [Paramecium bursaria]